MFIYVITGNGIECKIGITNNLSRRVSILQCGNPIRLRACYSRQIPRDHATNIERAIHAAMSGSRVKGEWFSAPPEKCIEEIENVLSQWEGVIEEQQPEITKPVMLPMQLIQSCSDLYDAIRLCVYHSGKTNFEIAECLGIDPGHWSRMMHGEALFQTNKITLLMQVCGNYAPIQYEAWSNGFDLVEQSMEQSKDLRIRELESELEKLRSAA